MKSPPTPVSAASYNIYFRLDRIIDEYSSMKTMPRILTTLRASPADDRVFQQILDHDYQRLQERSPDLEDHELNVFEAAFLTLMRDTRTHPGAMAIYVEEILGVKLEGGAGYQNHHALKNATHTRTLFLDPVNSCPKELSLSRNPLPRNFVPSAHEAAIGQQIFDSIRHPDPHPKPVSHHQNPKMYAFDRSTATTGTMDDPRLTELLAVYREAKGHLRQTQPNTETYFTLARILCNKASDCIQYMVKVKASDARLVELRSTLERVSGGVGWEGQGTKRRRDYSFGGDP
ncbi:MAG: hypothetical protein Q9168_007460, partial [Polycauliona sp. 1 TL-2023]